MPLAPFALILAVVIIAAALTVWALTSAGPLAFSIAVPVLLIATTAVWIWRK